MDVDTKLDEQKKFDEKIEENPDERDGKSLDMSNLKDAITVETQKVERDTETIFGQSNQAIPGNGTTNEINMVIFHFLRIKLSACFLLRGCATVRRKL